LPGEVLSGDRATTGRASQGAFIRFLLGLTICVLKLLIKADFEGFAAEFTINPSGVGETAWIALE
jgi:hypothetical protein